ncbi:unnamed protein product [Adineta ricciae]|uniref:EGF-like domain-containing protein n=1 Tax=Adineta ricciae TaxID=249248 RepID=A0A816HGG0_ADIRI|nr:unnamed protein product [Adineta ricciae]
MNLFQVIHHFVLLLFQNDSKGGTNSPTPNPTLLPGQTTPPVNPGQSSTSPPAGITCAQNPCRNNRPCYNNGNSYFCYCGSQFSGTNCEVRQG